MVGSSMGEIMLCLALISFKYLFYVSIAGDTMFPNQPLKDGQNLVSAGGMFELGFFSPGSSSNRYIGIWYADKPPSKVVWVANREAPINSSTAILHLGLDGNLNLLSNEKTIWSTNTSGASVLQLLDSGNLVLSDSERLIWQSFDHPSHAMLEGMKIGRDFRTNTEWTLTAWKSDSDPSDTRNASSESSMGIDECREWCLQNCSCQAFAVITEGIGCIVWFQILIDITEFTQGGEDLYVRVAASEIAGFHHRKRSVVVIASAVFSSVFVLFISLCVLFSVRRIKGKLSPEQLENGANQDLEVNGYDEQSDYIMKDQGLPLFTFSTITSSTNNFSDENKIGEGGFGPVYKGILRPNGQEIAVKRLSKGSGQGVDEFKNEIKLIANLQHKNLVKLLGCCIKDEERILVYEYMPNRSLDHFLFDPVRAASLDWTTRVKVIHGVAQGLLYLHKYSRLRIIHRDLKSGNILLDSEMNPKISDFGIARIFGGNQDLANTNRVVGTYGYMPPEYVMEGRFSEKSDVFSFGVLLLEIVSGKRNCGAPQVGEFLFLTGYVWQLWEVGRISEMMDPVLHKSCPLQDLIRYVHVGLLCAQEEASERPTMSTVISFLSSELLKLPKPKGVAFFTQRRENVDSALIVEDSCSSNQLTITAPNPR